MSVTPLRRIVRYRNRKLYEPAERRFVTLGDMARTVAQGGRVEVRSADSGEDITAQILSRALAHGSSPTPASTDALSRLIRAGSDAAETVAGVVERVGGARMAASMRRVADPERLAESIAPLTRRFEDARQEVERIVGALVGGGRLTWEEGSRLRDDVGAVFRESIADVLGRMRDLTHRLSLRATPEMSREMADLKARLDQLEALAAKSFPPTTQTRRRPAARPRSRRSAETSKPTNAPEIGGTVVSARARRTA